jgi:hypothetical protein
MSLNNEILDKKYFGSKNVKLFSCLLQLLWKYCGQKAVQTEIIKSEWQFVDEDLTYCGTISNPERKI